MPGRGFLLSVVVIAVTLLLFQPYAPAYAATRHFQLNRGIGIPGITDVFAIDARGSCDDPALGGSGSGVFDLILLDGRKVLATFEITTFSKCTSTEVNMAGRFDVKTTNIVGLSEGTIFIEIAKTGTPPPHTGTMRVTIPEIPFSVEDVALVVII